MHVHDSLNKPHFSPQTAARSGDQVGRRASASQFAETGDLGGTGESSIYSATPEVVEPLVHLRDLPEVREEVIREVTERLANGVYLTRDAAEQTAVAFLSEE